MFELDVMVSLISKSDTPPRVPPPETRSVTTRAKYSAKRKRSAEGEEESQLIEAHDRDTIANYFARFRSSFERSLRDTTTAQEEAQAQVKVKDMALSQIQKETLQAAERRQEMEVAEVAEGAKNSVARFILQSWIKMDGETGDPTFNRAGCDVAKWQMILANQGGELEDDMVATEVGENAEAEKATKVAEQAVAMVVASIGDEGVMQA